MEVPRACGAPRFEARVVSLGPGTGLDAHGPLSGWRGAIIAVTAGVVWLCGSSGSSVELRTGALFWLEERSSLTVRNDGSAQATLHAVRRIGRGADPAHR